MEPQQEFEWIEAQKIAINVDLEDVAKQQLRFLAAVDRNRYLYDGPALERAIYRYNACWLPLLAKHSESRIFEGPLVVPLDCEWVWHCHRLNPMRYKSDCNELYGRILDNFDVVSTVQGICGRQTEEIWNEMYPDEPYNTDLMNVSSEDISERIARLAKYTKYDLVSAAKRQSPFFYQVSRPHMNSDVFIKEAVARYKGFLYLIKRNKEKGIKRFCVPTYDIDLIWHSHQLCPVSYCKDLNEALGKVLDHDDMDSDRTKVKKLDVGFSGTTKQWEETFGTRYWKAGVMYRGNAPSPVTSSPPSGMICEKVLSSNEHPQEIQLQERKVVEVLLELVGLKNLPEGHKGSLFVVFSKSQPDVFFDAKRKLSILSESGEKQVVSFLCEPTGELHFGLVSHSSSNLYIRSSSKTLGSASFSMKDYLDPVSKLSVQKWLELMPSSGTMSLKPILLQVAISFTAPAPAPYMLEMTESHPFYKNSCFFNFPVRHQHSKSWTHVTDETGNRIISLQLRDLRKEKDTWIPGKEVIGLMKSGEIRTLAEFEDNGWSVMDNLWLFHLPNKCRDDGQLFEVTGMKKVKIFPGRKLDYESRYCGKQGNEMDFLTAVEFSTEDPYGKAVALLDLRSGFVKAKEKWMVLPGIILAFIASNISRKEGYESIIAKSKDLKTDSIPDKVNVPHEESQKTDMTHPTITNGVELSSITSVEARAEQTKFSSGGCGGGCGSGCGGGCGSLTKSSGCGGCGAGCGGGCGSLTKSSGCGGCGAGCGGGCANMIKSGGCGGGCGGCGGGCGSLENSGGCGGCGSGCGGCGGGFLDSKCGDNEVQGEKTKHAHEAVAA